MRVDLAPTFMLKMNNKYVDVWAKLLIKYPMRFLKLGKLDLLGDCFHIIFHKTKNKYFLLVSYSIGKRNTRKNKTDFNLYPILYTV